MEDGARLAMEAARRDPTPWPTGSFVFSTVGSDLSRGREHRQRVCELPAGTGADLCHRPAADGYSGARPLPGVPSSRTTGRCPSASRSMPGCDKAQFPVHTDRRQTAVFNLQHAAARAIPVRSRSGRSKGRLRPAPWRCLAPDGQHHGQLGYWKSRIEMAGITTPFTTPNFPFLRPCHCARSTISTGVRADERADRLASRCDTKRRPRTRRVHGRRDARDRASRSSRTWRSSAS